MITIRTCTAVQDASKHHRFVQGAQRLLASEKSERISGWITEFQTAHLGVDMLLETMESAPISPAIYIEIRPYWAKYGQFDRGGIISTWLPSSRKRAGSIGACQSSMVFSRRDLRLSCCSCCFVLSCDSPHKIPHRQTRCSSFGWSFSVALIARRCTVAICSQTNGHHDAIPQKSPQGVLASTLELAMLAELMR